MPKYLTKKDFRSLAAKKEYKSEDELEDEVIKKLPALLNVKSSQVTNQFCTTGFDGTLSNCADIVVKTNEDIPHPLIVFELKLDRNIKKFHGENYTEAEKQLRKYCQDIRALYGIILTDNYCLMYRFDYNNPESTRERIEKMPFPEAIDKEMGRQIMFNAILHPHSFKYLVIVLLALSYVAYLYGLDVERQRNISLANKTIPISQIISTNVPKNISSSATKNYAVVSFTTSKPALSSILLFHEGSNLFMEVGDTAPFTTQHSMVFRNLIPNTTYYYKIIIGNEVFDNDGQFYTFSTLNN